MKYSVAAAGAALFATAFGAPASLARRAEPVITFNIVGFTVYRTLDGVPRSVAFDIVNDSGFKQSCIPYDFVTKGPNFNINADTAYSCDETRLFSFKFVPAHDTTGTVLYLWESNFPENTFSYGGQVPFDDPSDVNNLCPELYTPDTKTCKVADGTVLKVDMYDLNAPQKLKPRAELVPKSLAPRGTIDWYLSALTIYKGTDDHIIKMVTFKLSIPTGSLDCWAYPDGATQLDWKFDPQVLYRCAPAGFLGGDILFKYTPSTSTARASLYLLHDNPEGTADQTGTALDLNDPACSPAAFDQYDQCTSGDKVTVIMYDQPPNPPSLARRGEETWFINSFTLYKGSQNHQIAGVTFSGSGPQGSFTCWQYASNTATSSDVQFDSKKTYACNLVGTTGEHIGWQYTPADSANSGKLYLTVDNPEGVADQAGTVNINEPTSCSASSVENYDQCTSSDKVSIIIKDL